MQHGGLVRHVLVDGVVGLLEVGVVELEVGHLTEGLEVDGQNDLCLDLALLGVIHRHLALLQEGHFLRQLLQLLLDHLRDQLHDGLRVLADVLLHLPVLVGPGTLEKERWSSVWVCIV